MENQGVPFVKPAFFFALHWTGVREFSRLVLFATFR